jgi:hypothetical protein
LDIPPHRAELVRWGRDDNGQWWALVSWTEDVLGEDGRRGHRLTMSAWARAAHVRPAENARSKRPEVPRVELGQDPDRWAGIGRRTGYWSEQGWHAGVIDGEDPLPRCFTRVAGHGSGYG